MDWSELNSDLLHLISKKLGDVSNFVCLRAVCKNWRSVVGPSDLPPQLPYCLSIFEYPETRDLWIFSLYSNKTRTLHIPQLGGRNSNDLLSSPRHLRVVDFRNSYISFFNPLTESYIPPNGICSNEFYDPHTWGCLPTLPRDVIPVYIGPSHDPSENGDIAVFSVFVFCIEDSKNLVSFWRFDERRVTRILELPPFCQDAMVYFKGKLFVSLMHDQETRVIDVITRDETLIIPEPGMRFDHLIEACGDLLGVQYLKHPLNTEQDEFGVYRLEENGDGKNLRWVETTDIGDRILFLCYAGRNKTSLCLKASDFEGFTGNCIYFTKSYPDCDIYRYDLQSKELEVIHSGMRGDRYIWFMPSLA